MKTVYGWVTPAFINNSVVDHTWITTYDSRATPHPSLAAVQTAQAHYWFCWGNFHPKGNSKKHDGGLIVQAAGSSTSFCLVSPNVPNEHGTIFTYGVHGVCHQLANQVLFPSGVRVEEARGYRLSSALYGSFGRRADEWIQKRLACGKAIPKESPNGYSSSPLYTRARRLFGSSDKPRILERMRRALHLRIDFVAFESRPTFNSAPAMAEGINREIRQFVLEASGVVQSAEGMRSLFGVETPQQADLVDPEYFRFPER